MLCPKTTKLLPHKHSGTYQQLKARSHVSAMTSRVMGVERGKGRGVSQMDARNEAGKA